MWYLCGKRGTGKSFEALEIAAFFRERRESPKRTIILDHTQNDDTYGGIDVIQIDDLRYLLPGRACVRVQTQDWSRFLDFAFKIKNASIVIDDATGLWRGNVPDKLISFVGLAKNHRLELIMQFHTIADTAPSILKSCNMLVIKQTNDSFPIKKSAPNSRLIERMILDCGDENSKYDPNRKWATRLVDINEEMVYVKNPTVSNFAESYKQRREISEIIKTL
ncbi:hypothetical protein [Pseudarcicella hirudinis]|uniref:hypothetical protein n=1 Tax=Pseudarcicella hirudinis TaxID=1079859 RepID=UPI00116085AA|nr:hypothetical protein [Pseudarcicella hirudinis]